MCAHNRKDEPPPPKGRRTGEEEEKDEETDLAVGRRDEESSSVHNKERSSYVPLMFHTRLQALATLAATTESNGIRKSYMHENWARLCSLRGSWVETWGLGRGIHASSLGQKDTACRHSFYVCARPRHARLYSRDMKVDRQSSSYDVK